MINRMIHSTGLFLTILFSLIRYYTLTHFSFWPIWPITFIDSL